MGVGGGCPSEIVWGGGENSRHILIKHRKRTDPGRKGGENGTARFRRNASETPSPPSDGSPLPAHPPRVPGRQRRGRGSARRSAVAPRGSSAGLESGRCRDLCIYLFVALKTEQWGGRGGGITGFLNAFAVHAESYLFKPNTTQTRHKHTRTFFKKRLQMCPFKKRL